MFDTTFMTFGDKVYRVNENNTSFSRKRLTMVDEQGNEWYRYDTPRWEYSIDEIVYCGKVVVTSLGETSDQLEMRTQMHFKYPNGEIYWEYEDDLKEAMDFFSTLEEAHQRIAQMKECRAYK